MIPSDHFVRFYNEVFKFLDERGGLNAYYSEISAHQEFHCLKDFREKGLRGVHDYYIKIRREENCDLDIVLSGHELILRMNRCPSLSKAIDNDAGACGKYCLHCPGWTMPLYRKAGLWQIFDLNGLDVPQCTEWIYDDRAEAERKLRELRAVYPKERILCNFE
jgi:hypothetical protein